MIGVPLLCVANGLYMLNRQTNSSMNVRAERRHGDLLSKIGEQRAALHRVNGMVEHIEDRLEGIDGNLKGELNAVKSKCDATHNSVLSLQHLSKHFLSFIMNFPQEIRDLLDNIVQADRRTYQAILQIQARLANSPSSLHGSNIHFTNALGEYRVRAFLIRFVSRRSGLQSRKTFLGGWAIA